MAAKILRSLAVSAFCEDMAMMLAAGIQVDDALSMMRGSMLLSATDIPASYDNLITDNLIIIIIICCSSVKNFVAILRNFRNKIWS